MQAGAEVTVPRPKDLGRSLHGFGMMVIGAEARFAEVAFSEGLGLVISCALSKSSLQCSRLLLRSGRWTGGD